MSYLARSLRPARAALTSFSRPTISTFHTTSIRNALSENDHDHSDQPNRDQKIESHKQDSVSKAKSGQGEWRPELASNSEAGLKAEKEAGNKSMKEMQDEGARKAQEGKNPSS